MKKYVISACISVLVAAAIVALAVHLDNAAKPAEPQAPQAMKYRFYEPPCPDGLRVEYVGVYRRPRSVVCQQEIGGK